MFCSTIIPTVARDTLERAVNSVLSQSFDKDDFEIIVVNDSGKPLPWQYWQSSKRVRIIHTKCRERSVARNTGAAIAKGRYLHFLDDDDWLFLDALDHFWTLSKKHQASWLYGSSQLVDRNGNELIQLHHGIQGNCFLQTMAGEWIPLQSSLIDTEIFHKLGGFSPLITGPEDIDLLRRVCIYGNIAETPNLIAYVARGDANSTTNYSKHPEMSRWAREIILETEGVFSRMREGASSGYWFGKMLRIYLTSAIWNLLRKRIFAASSRIAHGMAVILLTNYKIFTKGFWDALSKPYQSPTFERGFSVVH
ncbi:MAG: glycosyltransferase [Anaerolineales bacterium]|jgi:glycosyltransferase involved in cell wall biosynthesis